MKGDFPGEPQELDGRATHLRTGDGDRVVPVLLKTRIESLSGDHGARRGPRSSAMSHESEPSGPPARRNASRETLAYRTNTVAALSTIIPNLQARGFRFVTLCQLVDHT